MQKDLIKAIDLILKDLKKNAISEEHRHSEINIDEFLEGSHLKTFHLTFSKNKSNITKVNKNNKYAKRKNRKLGKRI